VATNDQHEQSTTNSASSDDVTDDDGGWNGATPFPLIQGTDACGIVVQISSPNDPTLLGKRVLIRPCMRVPSDNYASLDHVWMASNIDGAFAQYVQVPAAQVFPVNCDWTDAELASIPCAYGTSENMLHRAHVQAGDHVLIPGASGGVGSATVQLAKRRGATVTALVGSEAKAAAVRALGADRVIVGRHGDAKWNEALQELTDAVDVVVDNVGGSGFPTVLNTLKRGGRLTTSGAISGPLVELDFRTLYLKDLTLIGCTAWEEPVMRNLVGYIERGEIKPAVDKVYPMTEIVQAQKTFLEKKHVGKFVLIPPPVEATLPAEDE